jgi:Second Messenger Oligonucleotide or Dinucleotide Synthetase domain
MNYADPMLQARRTQIVEVLETVCESLELSTSQFALAKQRYEGVGACLAGADHPMLRVIAIYLQGSTALRTTVRPIGVSEHDVDLVAHVRNPDVEISPAALKKAISDCLRANGNYAPLLEEMPRCWRLSYANEFHMDITPSIPNPNCRFGGELVPDKTLKVWKASNPKGYKRLFEERSKLAPVIRLRKHRSDKCPAAKAPGRTSWGLPSAPGSTLYRPDSSPSSPPARRTPPAPLGAPPSSDGPARPPSPRASTFSPARAFWAFLASAALRIAWGVPPREILPATEQGAARE